MTRTLRLAAITLRTTDGDEVALTVSRANPAASETWVTVHGTARQSFQRYPLSGQRATDVAAQLEADMRATGMGSEDVAEATGWLRRLMEDAST